MTSALDPHAYEEKWQAAWEDDALYEASEDPSKTKKYDCRRLWNWVIVNLHTWIIGDDLRQINTISDIIQGVLS